MKWEGGEKGERGGGGKFGFSSFYVSTNLQYLKSSRYEAGGDCYEKR